MTHEEFQTYLRYIQNETVREPIYTITFLDKFDETSKSIISNSIVNNSCTYNVSFNNGVRRTCSFELINNNNQFTELFSTMSIGNKFQLSMGYRIGNKDYLFPAGVYTFNDPTLISNLSNKTISLSGTDKWSMLDGTVSGGLEATYNAQMGSKLGDVIKDTLGLNIVNDSITPYIDETIYDFKLTYDIVKEVGSYASDILLDVALNANANIFYDVNGRLNVVPMEYDADKASIFDFKNNRINYIDGNKLFPNSEIYNYVFLIADNLQNDLAPIMAYAENNNPTDPNSIINLGTRKVKQITDYVKGIDTQTKAQERVNYELKLATAMQSAVTFNSLAIPHLDVNQVITITDPYLASDNERFLVMGLQYNVGSDFTMSVNATKAKEYLEKV